MAEKSKKKVTVIHTAPVEEAPIITEAEPTPRDIINYTNNAMLQIIACIDQAKCEILDELRKHTPAVQAVPLPPPNPMPIEYKSKPWYKNWFAWVLSVIVLAMIGYGIYLLLMVESGKRIILPWAH